MIIMYINKNISERKIVIHDSKGQNYFLDSGDEVKIDRDCTSEYISSKKYRKPRKKKETKEDDS